MAAQSYAVGKIRLVAAGSFDQFCTWCFTNGLHPKNPRVKYVHKPEDLRGFDDAKLVVIRAEMLAIGNQEIGT